MQILEYFSYPPILTGFIALTVAGLTFPLAGVFVIKLNLIPMRFMLMHASLLGGAVALAFSLPQWAVVPGVNLLFAGTLIWLARTRARDLQYITAFLMVVSVAAAFVVIQKTGVPAKDTLVLLWGSIFALNTADIIQIFSIAALFSIYIICFRVPLTGVLYDRTVAVSSGIRYRLHFNMIVVIIGVAIGAAMRLVGALLLDALLLLPAIIGIKLAGSLRGTFLLSSVSGVIISTAGFFLALYFDLPVSGSITIFAAAVFAAVELFSTLRSTQ